MKILINLDDCIKKGLIKKSIPSREQALASIEKAKQLLIEAQANLEGQHYNAATIVAYLSILNSCRAILFNDGFRERSHACVTRYLEEKHGDEIPSDYIDLLDHFRETRHDVQYEVDYFAEKEGAGHIVEFAEKFVKLMEKLLKK